MLKYHWGAVLCSPLLICLFIFLSAAHGLYSAASCSSAGRTDAVIEFSSYIQDNRGDILFFASVSRKSDRSSEEFLCLYQIAEQAAMFQGMLVRSSLLLFDTGSRIHYAGDAAVDYGDPSLYIDQVFPVKVMRTHEGTYMIGRWDVPRGIPRTPQVKIPDWIRKPPEQAGLLFAVGTVQRRTLEDYTFREADKQAFAELSNILLNRSYEGKIDIQGGGFGYASIMEQRSEVFLEGARIIARWRDSSKQTYYSLAFCPVPL